MLNSSSLHCVITHHVMDRGYAPGCAELAEQFEVSTARMEEALRGLAEYHGVVLHPNGAEVWVIHPFSTAPTPFVVRQGERMWWGNCAWCSLGIAGLVGDVTIETTFGAEGRPVTLHVDNGEVRESAWVHFPVPMAQAWENVIYTCSTMLVFESEAEVDLWCRRHSIARGDVRPVQLVYDFAAVWYGRHADADWRKWTSSEAKEIFARFGLTGPIWKLPDSGKRF